MGWKWGDKLDPKAEGVIWGDSASQKDHPLVLVVHCDTQADYDALVALLEANKPS